MAVIEFVNVGGSAYNIASTAYAVCDSNTTAKSITINGFALATGVTIHVKFTYAHTSGTPTLAILGGDEAAQTGRNIVGISSWEQGAVLTLTYDGANWVRDYVEAIASNNITGSGTENYLVKFSGNNTITNGPVLGSAVSTQNQQTAFLRSDGVWAAPSYTTNTDEKVKQVGITSSGDYPILLKYNIGTSDVAANSVNFGKTSNKVVTIDPSDGSMKVPGGITGNASTATGFASAKTIALTGNVTGSATGGNGSNGWSIATTIANGVVTNAMLAGSIENTKLSNSKVTIAGNQISLGGSLDAATLRTSLGLTQALRFVGSTTTTMSDGYTGTPAGISIYTGTNAVAPAVGDVVIDSSNNSEYVCISVSGTTYTWEILGAESSWALSNDVLHISGATGDIIYWSDTNSPTHLTAGSNGSVLKLSNGVPTWGTDSDTKVTQAYSTTNKSYPLLFSNTDGITSTNSRGATTALVNNAIYVNPSTGTINATEFVGGGSGLTGVTAASVAWANVTGKVFAYLYVNGTAAGTNNDNAATGNDNTYIHLYDNNAVKSTIKLTGAGGTSVSSTASSKNITITSKTYTSSGSANALTSLKLKYTDTTTTPNQTAHDDNVSSTSSTPTALGVVNNAVLFIKSLYYGTTSVSTGISES